MPKKQVILIVDDDPNNFDVIEGLLYKYDYKLFYTSSGKSALAQIDSIKPDLILLDVMMPEMNGMEVCQIVKGKKEWQCIPIIMVTALNDKNDLAQCLEMGADDFISKPVNGVELAARVQSMLRIKSQYDSLQEMLRLREEMTSIIVHDLRNPLANIFLCAGILKMPNLSQEIYRQKLEEINNSGDVLNNQIDTLLRMAKIQSGKLVLAYKETNLSELLNIELKTFHNIAKANNINLILKVPDTTKYFFLDSQLIRRVIQNLLSNAIKFSPENSNIICELNYFDHSFEIKIIDSGKTISDQQKELIFEKYQIGESVKGVKQIGLGLSFCKMAIEAHNGTIRVENNPEGRGNVFIISI
ncbi:response regulator [Cyanobacterium aponinum UTEX 3221]|uniref:hybrid sensor histidine kinase/response regulator n=1 Tax=Cyanobacterium aponinum TaxID=379064 RepID=UPI002B4BD3D7|nr:response regulator [Cyanobacterium aponinum]WRL39627.1 response regulator [Cyanobacterium aponinum UTEX 3221]